MFEGHFALGEVSDDNLYEKVQRRRDIVEQPFMSWDITVNLCAAAFCQSERDSTASAHNYPLVK
jgi:hypothetical protein